MSELPHRRLNPLTGEWVLVSPHRGQRPWQGQVEKAPAPEHSDYDPECYLCPGNARAGGNRNPHYRSTFVFTNDFSALLPQVAAGPPPTHHLLQSMDVHGTCRVLCYSPRHDLTLPEMPLAEIEAVITMWIAQFAELGRDYRWVQIFQNQGDLMGASSPHPHGQVWAGNRLPNEPAKEDRAQQVYREQNGSLLLLDYIELECDRQERIVLQNAHWAVVVPYWAVWPFETLLLPRRHVASLLDLSQAEQSSLAAILQQLLTRYDNLFEISFPYSFGWHGAPSDDGACDHWQLHAHFYPPLLRSATVRKFLVGYEMLAEAQRDLTAEQAAARLCALPEKHYRTPNTP